MAYYTSTFKCLNKRLGAFGGWGSDLRTADRIYEDLKQLRKIIWHTTKGKRARPPTLALAKFYAQKPLL